jgi:hemerythrin-like domain-containing protein
MERVIARRQLVGLGAAAAGFALTGCKKDDAKGALEVYPPEDLMREHGVLNRVMLVFDEATRRIEANRETPKAVVAAASVVKRFVHDYHEKNEETFLFPRFEQKKKLGDVVATLRLQHDAGRRLTAKVLDLAAREGVERELAAALRAFNRMYRPHEAREDTVIFPAMRDVFGARELAELAERFEDEEHRLFGQGGFESIVADVSRIEQELGIHDLASFTAA